jgi:ADP-ribose pyrophosphatase YjhB (NUDIX family)
LKVMGDNPHQEPKLVIGKPYAFCPWCGAKLIEAEIDSKTRKRCPKCDFIYYRNPIPAAGAIIELNGSIVMVKRKYPPYIGDWCFPAGFMEYGESPEMCCIREIKEETGLDITLDRLFKVYAGEDDPRTRAILILYLAKSNKAILTPGDDASEAKYFSLFEMPPNIAFAAHRRAVRDYFEYKKSGSLPEPTHG